MIFTSELLSGVPGIRHGFGTLSEPFPTELKPQWDARRPFWQQVHKTDLAIVREGGQQCGEVDALITREAGTPIAVVTADCVPILIAASDGSVVAAVHSGWRGTEARILTRVLATLKAEAPRAQWFAAIGPSIGSCCYEVSPEIADRFSGAFAAAGEGIAVPRTRHLDLQAVNAYLLREAGVHEIDTIRACTRCLERDGAPVLHSYRREGGGTRQYSAITRA